jgi:hypothetical protein
MSQSASGFSIGMLPNLDQVLAEAAWTRRPPSAVKRAPLPSSLAPHRSHDDVCIHFELVPIILPPPPGVGSAVYGAVECDVQRPPGRRGARVWRLCHLSAGRLSADCAGDFGRLPLESSPSPVFFILFTFLLLFSSFPSGPQRLRTTIGGWAASWAVCPSVSTCRHPPASGAVSRHPQQREAALRLASQKKEKKDKIKRKKGRRRKQSFCLANPRDPKVRVALPPSISLFCMLAVCKWPSCFVL